MRGPLALGDVATPVVIPGVPQPVSAPVPDPATYKVVSIPVGQRGTEATLRVMNDLAVEASRDPHFVTYVQGIVRGCAERDYDCMRQRIYDWVIDNVTYTNDPIFCEFVQAPSIVVFSSGTADCDDEACLVSAMAQVCGFESAFRAVYLETPEEASHVYCLVKSPNEKDWVPVDTVAKQGVSFQPSPSLWKRDPIDWVVGP